MDNNESRRINCTFPEFTDDDLWEFFSQIPKGKRPYWLRHFARLGLQLEQSNSKKFNLPRMAKTNKKPAINENPPVEKKGRSQKQKSTQNEPIANTTTSSIPITVVETDTAGEVLFEDIELQVVTNSSVDQPQGADNLIPTEDDEDILALFSQINDEKDSAGQV